MTHPHPPGAPAMTERMTHSVWVASLDYGYEGLRAPSAAFCTKDEADAYAKHMTEGGFTTYVVNEVPLMRFVPAQIEPATRPVCDATGERR